MRSLLALAPFLAFAACANQVALPSGPAPARPEPFATFSIVAYDPETKDLGVAVASRVLAVGAVVPWARAGVGAVATQAWADPTFGPRGLEHLALGATDPETALELLLEPDSGREHRQLGIVDGSGRVANFTGKECMAWAGAKSGEHYTVQGNILTGEAVLEAMARAFEEAEGELALRLMAALAAADSAGGDSRGKESAAILVVREKGGYDGKNDRYVDLRVDDHAEPVKELGRLLGIALGLRGIERAEELVQAGELEEAEKLVRRIAELAPEEPLVLYFLARFEARAARAESALELLERALARRPDLARHLSRDPFFEGLRGDERFEALASRKGS
jgi:uncharacterized Ntn-hydrolase superfamily protein